MHLTPQLFLCLQGGNTECHLSQGLPSFPPVPSSQPIVHLAPSLDVTPPAISVVQRDCRRRGQEAACLSAALCFQVTSRTRGRWDRRFREWPQCVPGHGRPLACLGVRPRRPHSCLPLSDLRFTASLDEWTAGARAAFDGSGQRLSPRRLRLGVGNVTCEQLHFHVLVRRGQVLLCIRARERGKGWIRGGIPATWARKLKPGT